MYENLTKLTGDPQTGTIDSTYTNYRFLCPDGTPSADDGSTWDLPSEDRCWIKALSRAHRNAEYWAYAKSPASRRRHKQLCLEDVRMIHCFFDADLNISGIYEREILGRCPTRQPKDVLSQVLAPLADSITEQKHDLYQFKRKEADPVYDRPWHMMAKAVKPDLDYSVNLKLNVITTALHAVTGKDGYRILALPFKDAVVVPTVLKPVYRKLRTRPRWLHFTNPQINAFRRFIDNFAGEKMRTVGYPIQISSSLGSLARSMRLQSGDGVKQPKKSQYRKIQQRLARYTRNQKEGAHDA